MNCRTVVFFGLVACQIQALTIAEAVKPVIPGGIEEVTSFRKPATKPGTAVPGYLWVEAEDFTDYGKWRLDTQFVHKMGSAYLLAAGVGEPIGNAVMGVEIPEAGTWRVWVRTRNWLAGFAPGKFTVAINGRKAGKVLGAGKPEVWAWESAGEFALASGPVTLELVDLSGSFARCDALLLTRDRGYVPPDGSEETEKERARFSGLPSDVADLGEFDVVVIGAGSSGLPAAVAAARNGARTALVHDRPVLGGNASDEMGVNVVGAVEDHPNAREGGIIEEAGLLRAKYGIARKHGFPKLSEAFHMLAAAETNLTVFNNQRVMGVEQDKAGAIRAVKAVDTLTAARGRVRGKLFIDCTGDGWVGYYAGAQHRFGREARSEFDEPSAPEQADEITMSGLLMGDLAIAFRSEDRGAPVDYTAPEWAVQLPSPLFRSPRTFKGGEWWLEHPGTFNDLTEPERARDELVRIVFAYWGYLKNDWNQKEKTRNYALSYVPHMDARRETRRLMGDYIFREQDAREGRIFPDRISYGGWPLDLHHPLGVMSGKKGFYDEIPDMAVPVYTIPYRSIYSTNVPNLFIAGRCMSCTHMGLGTLRVQGTLATVGQAAGTAAALCRKHDVMPRELGRRFIGELQQELLKDDQYIPEVVNQDPDDLARNATVTASSTYVVQPAGEAKLTGSHPLNTYRAVMVSRGTVERLQTVELQLISTNDLPVEVELHVRGSSASGVFSPSETDIAVAKSMVPPKSNSRVSFAVNCDLKQPYVWFWLPKIPGVEWALLDNGAKDCSRAFRTDKGWQVVGGEQYAHFTKPALSAGETAGYGPENVIDGISRIELRLGVTREEWRKRGRSAAGVNSSMWMSDPVQPMPQWLALDFGRTVELNTVQLTFDTDLNQKQPKQPVSPLCVKDYRIEIQDRAGGWKPVLTVRDNFLRHRVHVFPAVSTSRMRVVIESTNGDASARIFEIRAYNDGRAAVATK